MEKSGRDCIIFGMASITGRPIFFMQLWKMVLSSSSPISAFIQRGFDVKEIPKLDFMSWSFGIVLVIIPLLLLTIS